MLTSGDLINLELGDPVGSEAGLRRLAVVVTAQTILDGGPNVVQVIPLTRTIRDSGGSYPSARSSKWTRRTFGGPVSTHSFGRYGDASATLQGTSDPPPSSKSEKLSH